LPERGEGGEKWGGAKERSGGGGVGGGEKALRSLEKEESKQ